MTANDKIFDAVVIGVGGMGSAACYHLAKRGAAVLGLEQFTITHNFGSSHGETRLIRQAYFEHPDYVPLLRRAYTLWAELEAESRRELFLRTGLAIFSPKAGSVISRGIKSAAAIHDLPLKIQDPKQFKEFIVPAEFETLVEDNAGCLKVEDCIATHTELATKRGAKILANCRVMGWDYSAAEGVYRIKTSAGDKLAKRLVHTLGPWASTTKEYRGPEIKIHAVPLVWYRAKGPMPRCFAFDLAEGFFYGFCAIDGQVKVSLHKPGKQLSHPRERPEVVDGAEISPITEFVQRTLPGVEPAPLKASYCLYEMSPDEHFVINHDNEKQITFAAGFSGHGFKFSTVIGEILADLCLTHQTAQPIDFLGMQRF